MLVTLGLHSRKGSSRALVRFDVETTELVNGRRRSRLPPKAAALLLLLTARRIEATTSSLGWVTPSEIAALDQWKGKHTSRSLLAQIRREVRRLNAFVPALVETPRGQLLRGPFRLSSSPIVDSHSRRRLAQLPCELTSVQTHTTAESLYRWLEAAEPIWRANYFLDKPGEALSNLPVLGALAEPDTLVSALADLAAARRLRETGSYRGAEHFIARAEAELQSEANIPLRQFLLGMSALQRAWICYRRRELDATERWLSAADALVVGDAVFGLRGQLLGLRSLVERSRGNLADAMRALSEAARLFLAHGDVFHLIATYHNAACIVAAEAELQSGAGRREAMFRTALRYSERNESYCRRYSIGQNSVLNKLLQVGLHKALGDFERALRVASDAEMKALESQNYPEALQAHRHRLAIHFELRQPSDARRLHETSCDCLSDPIWRERFARAFAEELQRSRRPHATGAGNLGELAVQVSPRHSDGRIVRRRRRQGRAESRR
ncbi:MAG: hypothetical protein AB7U83_18560 [Vicinamibacterales bacterium]